MRIERQLQTTQFGFTLIEMMVVIAIMMVLFGIMGWNYLQYYQRNAVEASARTLRSFLNDAKDNAKNGRYMSSLYTPLKLSGGPDAYCYVGDLSDASRMIGQEDRMKTLTCQSADNGVGPAVKYGLAPAEDGQSLELGGSYYSWLEMLASGGIVLENWGVFFDSRAGNEGRLEMRVLCKTRPRCLEIGGSLYYSMNVGGNYEYPSAKVINSVTSGAKTGGTVARLAYLKPGVKILKPLLLSGVTDSSDPKPSEFKGVEFVPLYLAVQSPLDALGKVDFGKDSCYGERQNEIVLGDVEGRYLYKFTVGEGGDISEGCFCEGNWRDGNQAKDFIENEGDGCGDRATICDSSPPGPCCKCAPR